MRQPLYKTFGSTGRAPPGRSGFCWLLVGRAKCKPGKNNENGPEYKAIPGPENTLPPACAGGIMQGQGHVLIGTNAHRQPKVLLGQASRTCRNFTNNKRRSDATHIFVKKKGSDPRCPL